MTRLMLISRCPLTTKPFLDTMTNAWSLLYDEMYGPEDERDYLDWKKVNEGTHPDYELTADGFVWPRANDLPPTDQSTYIDEYPSLNVNFPQSAMSDDTISFTTGDKIELNLDATSKNGFWKYEEDLTMKEVRDYLSSTYKSHYTSQDSKTQTLDLIESIGDAEPFCRSNAIKYLSRFGKKNGKSKQDILKAIHYCILLYHFSGLHNQSKGTYETF